MKKLISLILLAALVCTLLPAALAENEVPFQVENGGFETHTLGELLPFSFSNADMR